MRAIALAAVGGAGLVAFEADTLVRESGIEPNECCAMPWSTPIPMAGCARLRETRLLTIRSRNRRSDGSR